MFIVDIIFYIVCFGTIVFVEFKASHAEHNAHDLNSKIKQEHTHYTSDKL